VTVATREVKGGFDSYRVVGEPLEVPGSAGIYRVLNRSDVFYKELGIPLSGAEQIERIEELVRVGADLGEADLSSSRGRVAWPQDAVIEEGAIVGVITPYPGDEFYKDPIGDTLMPRHLTYLRRAEEGVAVEIRLRLLRQLAAVLALLEHVDLVHGDIAAQNVLWRLVPRPSIFLIDCDEMHSAAVEGSEGTTEGWADPRKEEGLIASHDMRSDWFALALAIWRVTTLGPGTPEHGPGGVILPPQIPAPFREPLVRTFKDVMDPDPRPSPDEWLNALDEVLGSSRARRGIARLAPAAPPTPPSLPSTRPRPKPRPRTNPRPQPPNRGSAPHPQGRRKRRWGRMVALAAILAILTVVAASFIDRGPSVQQVRAEKAAARWARSQLHVSHVEAICPADSSLHAGARYLCRVETRGGAVAHVHVAVRKGKAVKRHLHLIAFRKRAIVRDLHAGYRYFRQHGVDYGLKDVSCPQTVAARSGSRFECHVGFTDGAIGKIVGWMRTRPGFYFWREAGTDLTGLNDAVH
jgi:hypothetical protein